MQLTLELKVTKKDKGTRPNGKATRSREGHENPNGKAFHGRGYKGKKGEIRGFQVEAYFKSQAINMDVDWLRLAQFFYKDHVLEWLMAQKDVEPNLMGIFPCSTFKAKLNERFTPHN